MLASRARPIALPSRKNVPVDSARRIARVQTARRARAELGVRVDCAVQRSPYDAETNIAYWQTRPVVVTQRLVQIGWEFGQWAARSRLRGPKGNGAGPAGMREVLTRLGPAFVKIGQALSSRPDIMEPDYLEELELLQDRIPPFPDEQAFAVLEEDLGRPVSEIFPEITPHPIAAASLGQVYRARLSPAVALQLGLVSAEDAAGGLPQGLEVAVKVQRPGVAEAIALDAYILRILAGALRTLRKLNTDLPKLVDEWASSLFRELNYNTEAENGIKFAEMYGHLARVYVPRMYTPLTTSRVLTMEWVNGKRLRSEDVGAGGVWGGGGVGGLELELVEVGVQCSLEQMLGEGFYHADPHPGNLLRTDDGQLAFLDFGMCGQVEADTRAALMRATLHLVNREYPSLANDLIDLGLLPAGSDRTEIVPAITGVFEEALKGGVSNLSFGALSANLGATMYRYKFRIPPYYTLLVRSLTVLEGIALSYDPNYKVLGAAYPWVARRLLSGSDPLLEDTLNALLYKDGQFQFARLESLIRQALKSPPRVSRPLLPAAGAEGGGGRGGSGGEGGDNGGAVSAEEEMRRMLQRLVPLPLPDLPACSLPSLPLPWPFPQPPALEAPSTPPQLPPYPTAAATTSPSSPLAARPRGSAIQLLLSMEGGAVRRILVDEVAAGLDAAWRVSADNWVAAFPINLTGRRLGLSESLDRQQLEGLSSLAAALSQAGAAQQGQGTAGGTGQERWSMDQAASILRWLVEEVAAVPPSQRQEGLLLLQEISQQLASRITARTLRSLFGLQSVPVPEKT